MLKPKNKDKVFVFCAVMLLFSLSVEASTTYNFSINISDNPFNSNFTIPFPLNESMLNVTHQGSFLIPKLYNITIPENITSGLYDYSINISNNFTTVGNFTTSLNFSIYYLTNFSLKEQQDVIIGVNVFRYNISNITIINETNQTQQNQTQQDTILFNTSITSLQLEGGIFRFIIPDAALPFNITDTKSIIAPNGSITTIVCEQFIICPSIFTMPNNRTFSYINLTVYIPKLTQIGNYTSRASFTLFNETKNLTYQIEITRAPLQNFTFSNLTDEEKFQLLKDFAEFAARVVAEAENKTRTIYENRTIINETIIPVTTYDFSFKDLIERALLEKDTTISLSELLIREKEDKLREREEHNKEKMEFEQNIFELNRTLWGEVLNAKKEKEEGISKLKLVVFGTMGLILFYAMALNFFNNNFKENNIYRKDYFGRD